MTVIAPPPLPLNLVSNHNHSPSTSLVYLLFPTSVSLSLLVCLSTYPPKPPSPSLPPSTYLTCLPTLPLDITPSVPPNQPTKDHHLPLSLHLTCLVGGTGSEWRTAAADIQCCLALCSIAPCTAAQSSRSSPVGTPHEPTPLAWLCE